MKRLKIFDNFGKKLTTDFTGCTDLIGQKKAQKTSAFAKAMARLEYSKTFENHTETYENSTQTIPKLTKTIPKYSKVVPKRLKIFENIRIFASPYTNNQTPYFIEVATNFANSN